MRIKSLQIFVAGIIIFIPVVMNDGKDGNGMQYTVRLKAVYDNKTIDIATEAGKEYKINNEFKIL